MKGLPIDHPNHVWAIDITDNQLTEPVKTKTSPFMSLDKTCTLIEEVFIREKSSRRKTYIWKTVV